MTRPRPGEKTLNFAFDGPLAHARTRGAVMARTDSACYTVDRRRKDGGYDRNFTNTASGRVSIAISRLTDPVVSSAVLHDGFTLRSVTVASRHVGRRGRVRSTGKRRVEATIAGRAGELVMLNAAQRNRRYRTLRTLQLTKQITLNQRTPIPASVHAT